LNVGSFLSLVAFSIVLDFLLVHVPRADRADQHRAAAPAQRENDEDRAALLRPADGLEAPLVTRVRGIGQDRQALLKQPLDRFGRDTVLLT
jgi:hypothetical protein